MYSWSLVQGLNLNHWGGSIEFKIPDCQRTPSPRGINYWELPLRQAPLHKAWYHTPTNSVHCRTPYTNNKQDKNTKQSSADKGYHRHSKTYHLKLSHPSKKKKKTSSPLTRTQAQVPVARSYPKLSKPFCPKPKTKMKKEYNLKAWERRTHTEYVRGKKKLRRQKYSTNEGTT